MEVKEITDGSVQELLHRLLRAEAVLQERARRSHQTSKKHLTGVNVKPHNYSSPEIGQLSQKKQDTAIASTEMSMRRVKCFNCNQKGHLAKMCPLPRKSMKRVTVNPDDSPADPWFRGVFILGVTNEKCQVSSKEPVYKVDIIVGGVPTRGLLDHGAQVTLVRQQLLPRVRETSGSNVMFVISPLMCSLLEQVVDL